MGIGINNSNAIGRLLNQHDDRLSTSFSRLSSGKQINSAKDNAAGLAIVERFASQITGSSQGYRNTNDGISLAQTADGYSSQINDLMQRGRELAMQSANGSLSDSDRASLQSEFAMIQDEVSRITETAEFNGQKLLNENAELNFQVDADAGEKVSIKTVNLQSNLTSNGFFSADLSSQSGASDALSVLDGSMAEVNTQRAEYGANLNRFESIGRNLQNKTENLSEAKSRILDTDGCRSSCDI
ncbi:MAG: flagellin FliC [gamma proteobacterium symbiont of Bathyaustriella thionipta]|nr:flagellin FliC [gamma proteobacterium symbiont of Bathyaustriella thionipta]MCU7950828.1 flagellin FliC [gamma proteobacterium symbiont of Bathyaustriella thionipta]MCU7951904.1 flagellin FliC [gamma proteobacterium symbiont of Bathyaustriella thionipta]MCU7957352.1 flagellin FliC [gamma proteobacterium symbiont of Bathyaustriella thionipta]MCU7966661.1 flagellin FliC [gamma proteobacterium symbiont of Bathyaustriella thionipta]